MSTPEEVPAVPLSPIETTKKEITDLELEREHIYKRFKEIEYELSYRRKLVESWEMIKKSELLQNNLLIELEKEKIIQL